MRHLEFDSSRNNLVGAEKKYHQIYLRYKNEFAGEDDLVVVVESEDKEKNRQFVERLGPAAGSRDQPVHGRFLQGRSEDDGRQGAALPAGTDTLGELRKTLQEYRPFLRSSPERPI